jgi:hypothetical protein
MICERRIRQERMRGYAPLHAVHSEFSFASTHGFDHFDVAHPDA